MSLASNARRLLGGTSIGRALTRQLRLPRGPLGHLVGLGLARDNAALTRWVIARLDPGPAHAVLEVGCGPGVGVRDVLRRAGGGSYDGVDPSPAMLRHAALRNRRAIERGRARFHRAVAADLPFPDDRFHAAFAVNVVYFWEDPAVELTEIRRVLAPDGHVAIGLRPRSSIPDRFRARFEREGCRTYEPDDVAEAARAAGFADVRVVTSDGGDTAVLARERPDPPAG